MSEELKNRIDEEEELTVTLTLEDDTELDCYVVGIYPAGDKEYVALLPVEQSEEEEGEVYLYRYVEDEEGNPDIQNIESDEEYEVASDAFDEWLDSAEYDEIIDAEDEE